MNKLKKYLFEGDFKLLESLGFYKSKELWLERYTNGSIEIYTGEINNNDLSLQDKKLQYKKIEKYTPYYKKSIIHFVDSHKLSMNHKYNLILPLYNLGVISLIELTTLNKQDHDDWSSEIADRFIVGHYTRFNILQKKYKSLQKVALEYIEAKRNNLNETPLFKTLEYNLEKLAKEEYNESNE